MPLTLGPACFDSFRCFGKQVRPSQPLRCNLETSNGTLPGLKLNWVPTAESGDNDGFAVIFFCPSICLWRLVQRATVEADMMGCSLVFSLDQLTLFRFGASLYGGRNCLFK